ncbi:hypothetical protein QJS10_CPA05g00589 [Acorus calamus]|uniref:Uncharacterized protein n=1 Tax=Acorus calamus TaxID=4465 RepID=A0AAV9EY86_ACOCL|nr:hypothetical protein QJS10_CPA05g00589 [Acorus calamus]
MIGVITVLKSGMCGRICGRTGGSVKLPNRFDQKRPICARSPHKRPKTACAPA